MGQPHMATLRQLKEEYVERVDLRKLREVE
jgi:hypothetical protein